jgi:hypothetical protein
MTVRQKEIEMRDRKNPVFKITHWSGGRPVRTYLGENISFSNEFCAVVRLDNNCNVFVSRPYTVEEIPHSLVDKVLAEFEVEGR